MEGEVQGEGMDSIQTEAGFIRDRWQAVER